MPPMDVSPKQLPLPKGWPQTVRAAILHAISLAHFVITYARGWAANSLNARVREVADIDHAEQREAFLRERGPGAWTALASCLPTSAGSSAMERMLPGKVSPKSLHSGATWAYAGLRSHAEICGFRRVASGDVGSDKVGH